MSTHLRDDDGQSEFGVVSRPVPTPRGGFMARPGLKTPPRHAVVVRGGNAPVSSEIPVARSSAPPPPPSEAAAQPQPEVSVSSSDKVTVRALRTPGPPTVGESGERLQVPAPLPAHDAPITPRSAGALESTPPPSDGPVAKSVLETTGQGRAARRRSNWPIVIAAAIGLLLGLVSVAMRAQVSPGAAARSEAEPLAPELPRAQAALPTTRALETRPPGETTRVTPAPSARQAQPLAPRRKSIF
jgi:hypothetical protein